MNRERRKGRLFQGFGMVILMVALSGGMVSAQEHRGEVLHREPTLATPPVAETEPSGEKVPAREVPPEAAAAATPVLTGPAARELPTMTINDLELSAAVDVDTLLRMMARLADINILVSPQVEGRMTFNFRGIAWDEAFRSIITSMGLTYAWQGEVLRVMTMDDMRRELEMETLLKEHESMREERRLVEPMIMQVIPLQYLVAEKAGKILAGMLAASGEGETVQAGTSRKATVTADSESNSVIVHAIRSDVDNAVRLLNELDRPRPLVQIEAKIVEATQDTARQLGVQWGGRTARMSGGRLITAGSGGMTSGGFVSDFPAQFATGLEAESGFSLGFSAERIGMNELLNMQLSALQREGRINIQASPIVTTLDNEMAVIESGEERAYRVSTGTGNVLDVSLEWKKAVLKLEVTPHVVDGQRLRVRIVAHKDSFDETKPQTNNEFPVNTKRAQTTVLLANGETTMIGGFSLESSSDSTTGVPLLMRLPILGHLFRNKTTLGRFDETIIFITPTIL